MCGIAGILGRIGPAQREALGRMARAMAHRGPDGEGIWESTPDANGHGCLLAHRRLAIIDLSAASDQPMVDSSTSQAMVFNGEIYNFKQLRARLEAEGCRFVSKGDTEVLFRLLQTSGSEALAGVRGMFAFAHWEGATRRLLLARDPLGIKPLYVLRNPQFDGEWTLAFASEVRALLASGLIGRPRLDRVALASVVWNGFVVGPHTIVEGIEQIDPGTTVEATLDGRLSVPRQFWRFSGGQAGGAADVRRVLADGVRDHLLSDVPLGVFLSGGVDSGAIANLAQRHLDRPLRTFTLAFEEASLNEGEHARATAQAIGTEHTECVLTEETFVRDLPRALDVLDQPSFDGINSFFMSRAVREAGLTVALVGTGGDELFGGYGTFRELPRLLAWGKRAAWIPGGLKAAVARAVGRALSPARGAVPPQTRWAKLPDMVAAGDDIIRLYQLSYALFLPEFQSQLIEDPSAGGRVQDGLPSAFRERLLREIGGLSPLRAISVLEQRCFLGERLLRDTDAASMAVSLEVRVPLVDVPLVEALASVPDGPRYRPIGRKQMLRTLGHEGLSPRLFDRPKTGFVLPFQTWIRRGLGAAMDEAMRDAGALRAVGLNPEIVRCLWDAFGQGMPGLYWSRVWSLYMLVRWCHRYGVMV